ncbi:hypothetical protein I6N95_07045 [Vagococcus sp. BWB3-3]|uniref:Uncharacterized protein n=1 Tax=Vagococcus allomyrinae TaxID=2794353 RepID=A0A940P6Q2_9ENTE|nr:hypothetical protein [Vagococcus allomyrinae]MBP1040756.1 hypothetical protein [Vagococcus allomyrinae]
MSIYGEVMTFLSRVAPFSMIVNIILGVILLLVGSLLLSFKQKTKGRKIGGVTCVTLAILAFLGSASTWFVSTFII